MNDLRYLALKRGLNQLTVVELQRIIYYLPEMIYDEYNFDPNLKRF